MRSDRSRPAVDVRARFPQLRRLGLPTGPARVPVIQQLGTTDCGAACLAMTLRYFGRPVSVKDVSEAMGIGRDGANALAIVQAARWFGLRARGLKMDPADLAHVAPGAILHWGFSHFVVFERLRRDGRADLVDPSGGRRCVSAEELRRCFTGVVLALEPTAQLEATVAGPRSVWRRLVELLRHAGSWPRTLVVSLLLQLFALALPVLTSTVIDRVIPRGDGRLLLVLTLGLGVIVGFYFLASMIRAHLLLQLRIRFDSQMTLGVLDHLLALPYAFFERRAAGDLMMRLNSNSAIREILTSGALSTALDGGLVTLYLLVILAADRGVALCVVLLGAAQLAVVLLSRKRQQCLLAENLQTQAAAESYLVEMLAGIETLKSAGNELDAAERWSALFVDQLNVSLKRGWLSAWIDSATATLRLAAPLVILGYAALEVLRNHLSLGSALAVVALAQGLLTPLGTLVTTFGQMQLIGSYIDRLEDIWTTEPEQAGGHAQPAPPLRGGIRLESVSFRYHTSAPEVVRGVSATIEPGQLVAIVGRSGSGKSTLAALLLGLYQPTSGRILYDDMPLAELDARTVRRQLGIVNQRAHLFAGSIRSNIALGHAAVPLEQITSAARCAAIHDEIVAMPMGYDTVLSGGGAGISGGQRQRLALARALVRRPAVLLLDEATSALDAVTEAAVQANLQRLGCTRVVIAHRLSTIRDADLILVMDEGRLVEAGRHDELVAARGHYTALVGAASRDQQAVLRPGPRVNSRSDWGYRPPR